MSRSDKFRFPAAAMVLLIACIAVPVVLAEDLTAAENSFSQETGPYELYTNSMSDPEEMNSSFGIIQVVSIPDGAVVTLDGIYADTTPATFANLSVGEHVIEVVMPGYEVWTKKVMAVGGKAIYIDATLKPARNETGTIMVSSSPSGADIYIDGIYRGFTPKTIGNLPTGVHGITLVQAGEMIWEGTVFVNPGEVTGISQVLMPILNTDTGSISVSSNPVGAAVYLDGDFIGITYAGDMMDINNVSPGTHEITLRMNGYRDYVAAIEVPASRVVKVNPTLALSQIPHPSGQMQIHSAPEGAAVYLDNKFRGYTPLTLQDIEVGQHELRMKMPGKSDYHDIVRVTAYQTAEVYAVMDDVHPTSVPTGIPGAFGIVIVSAAAVIAGYLRKKNS